MMTWQVRVSNAGWSFRSLDHSSDDEALTIRGYQLAQAGHRELVFDEPGEYVVDDGPPPTKKCVIL